MTRMLRKKYIYTSARQEIDYLIEFYRDFKSKRGRQVAGMLEAISEASLHDYLDSFIDLKSTEYKIELYIYTIAQQKSKLKFQKILEQQKK